MCNSRGSKVGIKMRILGWVSLFLISSLGLAQSPKTGAKLSWSADYSKALASTKKDGKPIVWFFTGSTWCGPCKQLHKLVLSNPEFSQSSEFKAWRFVTFDIPGNSTVEMSNEMDSIFSKFYTDSTSTPTMLFTDTVGHPFVAISGLRVPEGKTPVGFYKEMFGDIQKAAVEIGAQFKTVDSFPAGNPERLKALDRALGMVRVEFMVIQGLLKKLNALHSDQPKQKQLIGFSYIYAYQNAVDELAMASSQASGGAKAAFGTNYQILSAMMKAAQLTPATADDAKKISKQMVELLTQASKPDSGISAGISQQLANMIKAKQK